MKTLEAFPYSNILVLGLAKSGTAAAKVLLKNNKYVRINDGKVIQSNDQIEELKEMGAEVIIGSHPFSVLDDIQIVVKNPGIPYDNPIVAEAEKRNIPVITEIEIAGLLTKGPIIGITGSNGKTTTTTLITEMLKCSQKPVKVAGNIGKVATDIAQTTDEDETMVIELSSFQLQGIKNFKPNIAVLLNIYEAHLDYHKTFENYKAAKFNIFKSQTKNDYLVYNADDPTIIEAIHNADSIKIPFSRKKQLNEGVWIDEQYVYFKNERVMSRKDIVLVGEHNLENILAAIAAAKLNGATNSGIYQVLTTFQGVKHRLQFVDTINNRTFYNDSKATNILATQKALGAFKNSIILLAGGLDRGNEFHDLLPFLKKVKGMVVFGQTADKLAGIAKEAQIPIVVKTENVQMAVKEAYEISAPADTILLSPACASWDQYKTFEERGDMFIQAVHTLR